MARLEGLWVSDMDIGVQAHIRRWPRVKQVSSGARCSEVALIAAGAMMGPGQVTAGALGTCESVTSTLLLWCGMRN